MEPTLDPALLIAIAAVVALVVLAIVFEILYRVPTADQALIITGAGAKGATAGRRLEPGVSRARASAGPACPITWFMIL